MKVTIKEPLISEKSAVLNEMGIYVFKVDRAASKVEIKRAIEVGFDVKVERVNTALCRGRSKVSKFGVSKAPKWKKAMIKLKDGEKISMFEGA